MSTHRIALSVILVFALLAPGAAASLAQPVAAPAADPPAAASGAMLIVENAGQWPAAARFQVWNSPLGAGTTWLAEDAIWLVVSRQVDKEQVDKEGGSDCDNPLVSLSTCPPPSSSHALKLTFPGSNPDVRIEPLDPLTTTVSYFLGSDPAQWRPDAPVWGGVRYADLYPGVDLVLGLPGGFWRLEARPGAAANRLRLRVEGADRATLAGDSLRLTTALGDLNLALPATSSALHVEVVAPQAGLKTFSWQPGVADAVQLAAPLALADVPSGLLYSTFLGGSRSDWAEDVAVDGSGRAVIVGLTYSTDFPVTPGAFDTSLTGNRDLFVARFSANGSSLEYATFLGGSGEECQQLDWCFVSLAVDSSSRAYIAGMTSSPDFPTTAGAFDRSLDGASDGFAVRISADGSALEYGAYLGGSDQDWVSGVAVSPAGWAVLAGSTSSADFPATPGAYDTTYAGGTCGHPYPYPCLDGFVVRLNDGGSALEYGTFLGGSGSDGISAVAVDSAGRACVGGSTDSSDFPATPGAFDTSYSGPPASDAFLAALDSAGSSLLYATYLGGLGMDPLRDIAIDGAGRIYATGYTTSGSFPTTPGAFDPAFSGEEDAYVVRLSADGSVLAYGTFLGGNDCGYLDTEWGWAIAVDGAGRAFVAGRTTCSDFPTTPWSFDPSYNGGYDGFAVRLSASGSALEYGAFLGGAGYEHSLAIAVAGSDQAIIAGITSSSAFPTTPGAFDVSHNGLHDAFAASLAMAPYAPNVVAPIEQPRAGAFVSGIVTLSGFAVDLASPAGAGIRMIHIYLDGPYTSGTVIGSAACNLDRPDVAAQYGPRFAPSGWELAWNTIGLAPGAHQLYLYAYRTTDSGWSEMEPYPLIMAGGRALWLPGVSRRQ